MTAINIHGNLLDFESPKIMGILNLTSDSFYDGSKYNSLEKAIEQSRKMIDEGADIIDIGAASSRPGSNVVSKEVEWKVIKPILIEIRKLFPAIPISIDTFHSYVAERGLEYGADIINDITAGSGEVGMVELVKRSQVPYIMMHMKGIPQTMQVKPQYEDLIAEVLQFFIRKIRILRDKGIKDILIDPGFGFGKTIEHNYKLLNLLGILKILECPILVGISRKSMIYKLLDITPEESLCATSALHLQALINGANILRVHDVREAKEIIKLHKMLEQNN